MQDFKEARAYFSSVNIHRITADEMKFYGFGGLKINIIIISRIC